MKDIAFKDSYNLDILSFLNVMSADEYYVSFYRTEFDRFYPLLSDGIKTMYKGFLESIGRSNIAVALTTAVSLIDDFNNRDVQELLVAQEEIKANLYDAEFPDVLINGIEMLPQFAGLIVQLIQELEDNGFKKFWKDSRYPLINDRADNLKGLSDYNMLINHVQRYKEIEAEEVNVYICSFAHPHGTKIFRDSLIIDYKWPDKTIINTIAHELYHPPYNLMNAKETVDKLAEIKFVKDAYSSQNPQTAYRPIEVFIEENIVEALGTYIAHILGYEEEPYKYFKKHDEGSHVISPYLFKYLLENNIKEEQIFEDYFTEFVDDIGKIQIS